MTVIYGIPNCDSMKKARAWLAGHGIDYQFHDYKKAGIEPSMLQTWIGQLGWDALLNRRGMTWRKIPQDSKDSIDQEKAAALMLHNPSIIKRPVLHYAGKIYVGFNAEQYAQIFAV